MKVTVIGAGVMGPGIAQIWLMGGHEVVLTDLVQKALEDGRKIIYNSLQTMKSMEIIKENVELYMSSLEITTSLEQAVKGAKLVIEVVPERMDIKQQLYKDLDIFCNAEAIIVSNTSSLPLPEMFPDFRSGKFFVAHFFNPPQIIPLVTGDGAFGYGALEYDTCMRYGLDITTVILNDNMWGMIKRGEAKKSPGNVKFVGVHLREVHYEKVVQELGGYGEFVTNPEDVGSAIDRALASGKPACVNVVTDPEIGPPR